MQIFGVRTGSPASDRHASRRSAPSHAAISSGGVDAFQALPRTGRPGSADEATVGCARVILCEPGPTLWTLPCLEAEIDRRCAVAIAHG